MNVRPLLLAALALGFAAGCTTPSSSPSNTPSSEPGTPSADTAARPAETAPPKGNEPGTEAQPPPPSAGSEVKAGESAVYIVKDSGVRCIAPPCPSYNATRADKPGSEPIPVHEVDLSALSGGSDERAEALTQQMQMGNGLKVEATLETRPNAGPGGAATVLKASRVAK
ncbi:hypothetical protein JY651_39150 [Pyxidicoccus parkwayensis]|uniref:DUF6748 domain-containing protein n=1 Tax=Pyxidicoccus parkwayensis TaxID=2813578 RepID=A0ABX7NQM0_9BACT|nr:DUF6748 domain-containing protein [Pyxidicoccus parkwaysis]QSQ21161.1 hypothetical protein JY651_39150 [Pyxidicoccus parkwaysis]